MTIQGKDGDDPDLPARGGKEQLYIAALEQACSTARDAERQLGVEHLDPVAAIRRLTRPGQRRSSPRSRP